MRKFKKIIAFVLSGVIAVGLAGCGATQAQNSAVQEIFTDDTKISYSLDYKELKDKSKNKPNAWREGMVSGNGLQGFVESGSPYSDTFIFQNMHFIMPNNNPRTCPDTASELETVRQNIVNGEDITDDAEYLEVYSFHPGGQLRISMDGKGARDYIRYTDFESSQVGVRFTDENGTWDRTSFTSMADGAVITKLSQSSEASQLNVTLTLDDLSTMANFGDGNEADMEYKKVVDINANTISLVAHYPNYENSELKNGGYATTTYVVTDGTKEKIELEKKNKEDIFRGQNSGIKISDAQNIYLITISDRTYDMGSLDEFEDIDSYELVDELTAQAKAIEEKYSNKKDFDYNKALKNHLEIYQPQFDAVTLELEDSDKSNDELLKEQKGEDELSTALAQRSYYAGRYAYLCCSGYSTSRLYGMWTGEFNTGWGSKYTMDANVNLQTSSMNTGNLSSSPIGYTYFILRQLPDWEENAKATHGFTDAIQAPVNTDGDKAVITESYYPYPFRYWNAGASWMLEPLYETLQTYGNIQIPLSDEFDLNKLKSVLSIDEDDIARYKKQGYMMLEEDILLPTLTKSANYWAQLLTPEYYTDKDGIIHYEKGKTKLNDGETYCIIPSYSPENNPSNYDSPSTANCAIDISACRNNLEMLKAVMADVAPEESFKKWQKLMDKLPPYLYDDTGAIKEWATTSFEENNEHRHLSQLYCAWPLFETQDNTELANACKQAVENRESENEASHALIHRSLIAARLKDSKALTDSLLKLQNHKIRYASLMTNHDYDRRSCYCTDFAIGYLGIINEALVYSNEGEIEFLPALPTGFEKGTIKGIRARTRATVDSLSWDADSDIIEAEITSDIDQKIKVKYGDTERTLDLKAGVSQTVNF